MVAPVASPVPGTPLRRRWWRAVLMLLIVALGLPAANFFYSRWSLDADIERAIAETDALDPGWRLADIEAARKTYRDDENLALHSITVRRMLGKRPSPAYEKDYDAIFKDLPAPAQLNVQQAALIRAAFEQYPDALVEARKLKDLATGEEWPNTARAASKPAARRISVAFVCRNW